MTSPSDPCEPSAAAALPPQPRLWRVPALLASFLIIALTVSPAVRKQPYDSFPLSSYPMFSIVRKASWIHVVVGFDADGKEYKIAPQYVANFEVMQAVQTIRREVRARRAKPLCEEVAARIAGVERLAPVVRLEVQSRKFDPARYFVEDDGREPIKLVRRARCPVVRGGDQ